MNLRKKILRELGQMTVVPVLLIGLGIYAHEFVISGLMAKPELNFSIIGAFVFALVLAYAALFGLFADISGLDAIRTDYMRRRRGEGDSVFDRPATVFARPKLLGYGYRLITEELQSGASKRLPTETVHLLIADVDMRVAETRATLGYFGGLLILLGLLGAFMGLMKTVHAVSDLIGAMDMSGAGGTAAFSRMIEGMKGPLNGMSVGFSSSLFGLLFSLALGVVDRFLINAMKAVRNEFEALLINLAQLDTTDAHGESHSPTNSGAGTRQGPGLGAEAGDDLVALRLSNDRIHDALSELNATAAGASTALRVQRSSAPMEAAVQRALEGLIGAQREMAAQMARFADAAVAASDARSDAEHRTAAALERQIELLGEIATQNMLSRNIAMLAAAPAPPTPGRAGQVSLHFNSGAAAEQSPAPTSRLTRLKDKILQTVRLEGASADQNNPRIPARPATARSTDPAVLRSIEANQNLTREVLRRMDEAKREDRRIVRELARRQDALVSELADLSRQIGAVMRTHDVMPSDRLETLRSELVNLQRSSAHDISRLEAQVAATRRTTERAELAAQATSVRIDRLAESTERRSRG